MIHQAVQSVPAVCSTAAATKSSSSILDPIAKPIADVLAFFYSIVPNYAVAILILCVVWMVLISPLTLKTTRSMLAMQKLAPEMKRLQEKHRNDRQALAAAQMELYKTHNVSPFGSCLPSILPLPVFIALFRVIDGLSHKSTISGVSCATPKYLSHTTVMYKAIVQAGGHLNAFGLDIAKSALSPHTSVATALPFYVLLLAMMGTGYLQTAQMMSRTPASQANPQMKMMKYIPLFFGVICIRFPAGVVLYYAMSNVCRVAQQYLMYRYDPKVKNLAINDVIEIEASAGVTDDEPPSSMFNRRKAIDTPETRKSRFSDLLGNARDQQAARDQGKDRKALGKGGSAPSRPGGANPKAGGTGTNRNSGSTRNTGTNGSSAKSGPAKSGSRAGAGAGGGAGGGAGKPAAPRAANPKAPNAAKSPPNTIPAGPGSSTNGRASTPSNGKSSTPSNGKPAVTAKPAAAAAGAAKADASKPAAANSPGKPAAAANGKPAAAGNGKPVPATGPSGANGKPAGGQPAVPADNTSPSPTEDTPVAPTNGAPTPSRTGAGAGRTGAGGGRTGGGEGTRNKRRGR